MPNNDFARAYLLAKLVEIARDEASPLEAAAFSDGSRATTIAAILAATKQRVEHARPPLLHRGIRDELTDEEIQELFAQAADEAARERNDQAQREQAAYRNGAVKDLKTATVTSEMLDDGKRPEIILEKGIAPWNLDEADKVLARHAAQLAVFDREGLIVRVVSLDEQTTTHKILTRPQGSVVLRPMVEIGLVDVFERLITWQKYSTSGELKPSDCPAKLAAMYLAREGQRHLPYLTGVVEAPILRPDGSILCTRGYDASTGLYLASSEDWSGIPMEPTLNDAHAAAAALFVPFAEFPFDPPECWSVLLAAILTALQRRLLPSAPLFGFSAPVQRSGKSLLAESVGLIAVGRKPAALVVSRETEEFEKAITSVLLEADALVNLDNIDWALNSKALAVALTQQSYRSRILGASRTVSLPTNVMWTVTGNNLCFRGELPSRSVLCHINANKERPEERSFEISDLTTYIRANRHTLVIAALTILRAYHVAGRPEQPIIPWGGFEAWSYAIRAPIVWLGLADPYQSRDLIIDDDPQRAVNVEVLKQWNAAFGSTPVLIRDVIAKAENWPDLKDALLEVAAARGTHDISPRRLGDWCRWNKERVIEGLRLIAISRGSKNSKRWSLRGVQ